MARLNPLHVAVIATIIAGCAATPRQYDADDSRALNLARAGGIYDTNLRDSPDGTRSYRKSLLMGVLNLASLATSLDAPLPHLSGAQTLLFNSADIMMTPEKPSAKPSLMGWMPASMAENREAAYERYVTLVDDAISQTARSMAITATRVTEGQTQEIDGHPLMLWSVKAERYGCTGTNCIIACNITTPHFWKTPSYVDGGEAESYNITANHPRKYSRLIFQQSGEEITFPMDDFYRRVSAALPPWIVIYFPPNRVFQHGEAIPYPVLYEQGRQLMFKEPAL